MSQLRVCAATVRRGLRNGAGLPTIRARRSRLSQQLLGQQEQAQHQQQQQRHRSSSSSSNLNSCYAAVNGVPMTDSSTDEDGNRNRHAVGALTSSNANVVRRLANVAAVYGQPNNNMMTLYRQQLTLASQGIASSNIINRRWFSSANTPPNSAQEKSKAKPWTWLKPEESELEAIHDKDASGIKELQEEYRVYQAARKQPDNATDGKTHKSEGPQSTAQKVTAALVKIPTMTYAGLSATGRFLLAVMRNPALLLEKWKSMVAGIKHEIHRYKIGSKLLWNDIKTAKKILVRMLHGHAMTRRERKQLLRTAADIFRMVPLAVFVIVPFLELLLPVALKLFPNLLPSTFQDLLKKEEDMKRQLRMRLHMAGFLQDTLQEMAAAKKRRVKTQGGSKEAQVEEEEATAKSLQDFIDKAQMGQVENETITRFARLFKDELMLDNLPRFQLTNLCRFMGLQPFGSDNFLRFQLRTHMRMLTQDDQRILWEGIDSLSKQELREACRERGMRATGMTKSGYRRQLANWLELSINQSVPISLLIMSRAFTYEVVDPAQALAESISSMDEDVVKEVMLEAASSEERSSAEHLSLKLESLARQNELIEEERQRKDAHEAKKKKEEEETKAEAAVAKEKEAEAAAGAAGADAKEAKVVGEGEPVTTEAAVVNESAKASGERDVSKMAAEQAMTEGKAASAASSASTAEYVSTTTTPAATTATTTTAPTTTTPAATVTTALVDKDIVQTLTAVANAAKAAGEPDKAAAAASAAAAAAKAVEKAELTSTKVAKAIKTLASESFVEKEKVLLAQMKAALVETTGKKDKTKEAALEAELTARDAEHFKAEALMMDKAKIDDAVVSQSQLKALKDEKKILDRAADIVETVKAEVKDKGEQAELLEEVKEQVDRVVARVQSMPGVTAAKLEEEAKDIIAAATGKPKEAVSQESGQAAEVEGGGEIDEETKKKRAAAAEAAEAAAAAKKKKKQQQEDEQEPVDKGVLRMQNKLASMLDKLEKDIAVVDQKIGRKHHHMLDRDRDGIVSAEELTFIIQHVLGDVKSNEDALEIVKKLDTDRDGQISVAELLDWAATYAEKVPNNLFDELYGHIEPSEEDLKKRVQQQQQQKQEQKQEQQLKQEQQQQQQQQQ